MPSRTEYPFSCETSAHIVPPPIDWASQQPAASLNRLETVVVAALLAPSPKLMEVKGSH